MSSLAVSHRRQLQQADCLAACSAMLLDYLQLPVDYARLVQLLGIRSYGAAFSNLRRLEELGVSVTIEKGGVARLRQALDQGLPVIVALNTGPLTHWTDDTAHALVVVGMEQDTVLVNDPEFAQAPQVIPLDEFLLAWLEQDYRQALIRRSSHR
ncbi:MAG TPA: cysteine peptidase family C39 domain-containing protein [Anaerolineae bacterium]|nr:cysteine peptidase family C39 domain-containing protein [Anaerolineae bacterium]